MKRLFKVLSVIVVAVLSLVGIDRIYSFICEKRDKGNRPLYQGFKKSECDAPLGSRCCDNDNWKGIVDVSQIDPKNRVCATKLEGQNIRCCGTYFR